MTFLTTNSELHRFREMNGKTVAHNMTFNNYGMTVNGKIMGTDLTFSEVFKRVTPQISGYYIFESQVGWATYIRYIESLKLHFQTGIEGLLKALGIGTEELASVTTESAFSLKEVGDRLDTVEFFGGEVKRASFPYNKEFDYQRPGEWFKALLRNDKTFSSLDWNVNDKRIVTKIAPGVVKTICKSKTTGNVWEYTMTFNSRGVVIRSKANGAESMETYKYIASILIILGIKQFLFRRGVHSEGVWRVVSQTGLESFVEALGNSLDLDCHPVKPHT